MWLLREIDFNQLRKFPQRNPECGAAQIFDLIRGIYVKTVAEQSTLIRYECDALQLTARDRGAAWHPCQRIVVNIFRFTNDVNVFTNKQFYTAKS